jgi:hypothetical protein
MRPHEPAHVHRINWKCSLPGLVLVALLPAFTNPRDEVVTSAECEYVQRVIDGDTLLLGNGETCEAHRRSNPGNARAVTANGTAQFRSCA